MTKLIPRRLHDVSSTKNYIMVILFLKLHFHQSSDDFRKLTVPYTTHSISWDDRKLKELAFGELEDIQNNQSQKEERNAAVI